jgi:hypothetical protein
MDKNDILIKLNNMVSFISRICAEEMKLILLDPSSIKKVLGVENVTVDNMPEFIKGKSKTDYIKSDIVDLNYKVGKEIYEKQLIITLLTSVANDVLNNYTIDECIDKLLDSYSDCKAENPENPAFADLLMQVIEIISIECKDLDV